MMLVDAAGRRGQRECGHDGRRQRLAISSRFAPGSATTRGVIGPVRRRPNGERVCVIGETVRAELFGPEDPVGRTMRIGRFPFRVIGLLAKKGQSPFGGDQDDVVVMPLSTLRAKLVPTPARAGSPHPAVGRERGRGGRRRAASADERSRASGTTWWKAPRTISSSDAGRIPAHAGRDPRRAPGAPARHRGGESRRGRHRRDEHHARSRSPSERARLASASRSARARRTSALSFSSRPSCSRCSAGSGARWRRPSASPSSANASSCRCDCRRARSGRVATSTLDRARFRVLPGASRRRARSHRRAPRRSKARSLRRDCRSPVPAHVPKRAAFRGAQSRQGPLTLQAGSLQPRTWPRLVEGATRFKRSIGGALKLQLDHRKLATGCNRADRGTCGLRRGDRSSATPSTVRRSTTRQFTTFRTRELEVHGSGDRKRGTAVGVLAAYRRAPVTALRGAPARRSRLARSRSLASRGSRPVVPEATTLRRDNAGQVVPPVDDPPPRLPMEPPVATPARAHPRRGMSLHRVAQLPSTRLRTRADYAASALSPERDASIVSAVATGNVATSDRDDSA